jgi:rare lipoprotein A
MTRCLALTSLLLLAACSHAPSKHSPPPAVAGNGSAGTNGGAATPAEVRLQNACAPTRSHRDSDYTPGGLYLPGVADSGPSAPIDVSGVAEPVPRSEPLSANGNRSPYTVLGHVYHVLPSSQGYAERGVASWYGEKFNGRGTSNGETYDICAFTAAHKTLPLPSYVRVTNLDNGRSLIVRINDRGPFQKGRLIDLSYAAAVRLGVDRTGTARVEVRSVSANDSAQAVEQYRPASIAPISGGGSSGSIGSFAGSGRHLLQVGSFADKDNARRVARRLKDADIDDVDVDHAEVGGRDVWRVQVGPVKDRKIAQLVQKIRALGLPEPRVFSE